MSKFKLYKEKAGVISEKPIWCLWHECWLYTGNNLFQLARNTIKYWKSDLVLIG